MNLEVLQVGYEGYISCSSAEDRKGRPEVLMIELLRVVSHHASAGNQTLVFCKSNKRCSELLRHLSSPSACGLKSVCLFLLLRTGIGKEETGS